MIKRKDRESEKLLFTVLRLPLSPKRGECTRYGASFQWSLWLREIPLPGRRKTILQEMAVCAYTYSSLLPVRLCRVRTCVTQVRARVEHGTLIYGAS